MKAQELHSDVPTASERPRILDQSYVLGEPLGEGGMGSVFRAVRRTDGRSLALKLVSNPSGAKAFAREPWLAIAREFEILSSLHHPNIVRVQSYGFDERLGPYFTMELLPAARDVLEAGRDAPLVGKVDLLTQLLRALQYVHRRGIVHRDIKPPNVLCVDGALKLLDFGVATSGVSVRRLAGTRPYMAPELLSGATPSVRSDLYAFGVLAGALLGGWSTASPVSTTRVTEVRPSDVQVTPRRLREQPLPDMPPRVHEALDLILAKLCATLPEDRYESAAEVLGDLESAVGRTLSLETQETRESFLQASEFVGREPELSALLGALDTAIAGNGSGWLVGGESGVGKSRVAFELVTRAMVKGVCVVQGQAVADVAGSYDVWLPVLRALALRAELPSDVLSVLKQLLPDLPTLLDVAIPDAPRVSLAAAETRLRGAIETLFRLQPKPTLVVLEDLQWVGADSEALLSHLGRVAKELRVLIVATYRSEEAADLPRLFPDFRLIELCRLERRHVMELATSMLGPTGSRELLVDYLCRETEGNPFFLVEVVRALAEQAGELDRVHRTELPAGLLTGGIAKIAQARLLRVPEPMHRLLELAAVFGRQLDLAVLEQLSDGLSLEHWLRTCANAAVLESQTEGWRFSHDKLREAIVARVAPADLAPKFRQILGVMERIYSGEALDSRSAALAYFAENAGDREGAARYHLVAGDLSTRRCSYVVARRHYQAALDHLASLPEDEAQRRMRVDLLLKQVYVTMVADPPETNLARMAQAKALLQQNAQPELTREDRLRLARADYFLGRVHFYRGDPQQALLHYRDVLPVAVESGDDELVALPSCSIAIALSMQGEMKKAEPLLWQSILPLERLGEPFEWFRAVGYHGFTLLALGRCDEGHAELERVHARAREIGQPSLSSAAHLMRGSGAVLLTGDFPAGLGDMQKVLGFAAQTGDKLHSSLAWSNTAWALGHLGRHEEAQASREKARDLAAAMGGRLMLSDWFEAADAELHLLASRVTDAFETASRVVTASSASGQVASLGIAERVIAEAYAAQGQPLESEAHFEISLRVLDTAGVVLQAARTRFRRALTRLAAGRRADAERDLNHAVGVFESSGCVYAREQISRAWRDAGG